MRSAWLAIGRPTAARRGRVLLAVVLVAGCRRTDRGAAPRPEPDAAPVAASGAHDAAAAADASPTFVGAGAPEPAPRFEVVAFRPVTEGYGRDSAPFELHDAGPRVVLTSGKPIGWADGPGALVREPRLAAGIALREPDENRPPDSGTIEGMGGTYPDALYAVYGILPEARAVKVDLSLFHWAGDGWRRDAAVRAGDMPVALVPFEDRGVVVAGYERLPEGVAPATWDGLHRTYAAVTSEGRKDLGLATAVEGIVKATRDGHTWVLGRRKGQGGIHLVHRAAGRTTDHLVPGTERCVAELPLSSSRGDFNPLQVAPGGRALVYVDEWHCTGMKAGIFEERPTRLEPSKLSDVGRSDDYDPRLAAVSADRAVWIGSTTSHVLWRAPAEGAAERRDLPRLVQTGSELRADYTRHLPDRRHFEPGSCNPRSVLATGVDDIWVVATCVMGEATRYDVVFRWGKPQAQVLSL